MFLFFSSLICTIFFFIIYFLEATAKTEEAFHLTDALSEMSLTGPSTTTTTQQADSFAADIAQLREELARLREERARESEKQARESEKQARKLEEQARQLEERAREVAQLQERVRQAQAQARVADSDPQQLQTPQDSIRSAEIGQCDVIITHAFSHLGLRCLAMHGHR